MSCIYTYEGREFPNRGSLVSYIEAKNNKIRERYSEYAQWATSRGMLPTPQGFKEFSEKFGGVPKQEASTKVFSVQGSNLTAIKEGRKSLSFRTVEGGRVYNEGDLVQVSVRGKNTDTYLRVKKLYRYETGAFPKLPKDRRDAMAQMLGDYADFETMLKDNDYMNPRSIASRRYPEMRNFFLGEAPGILIEYETVETNYDLHWDQAVNANPATDVYNNLLEKTIIEVGRQLSALMRSDNRANVEFKENRLERLEEIMAAAIETKDLLNIVGKVHEDLDHYLGTLEELNTEEKDSKEIIQVLFTFRMLTNSYKFLDEIVAERSKVIDGSKRPKKDAEELFKMLEDSVNKRNKIERTYLEKVEPALVKELGGFVATRAKSMLEKELAELVAIADREIPKIKANKKLSDKTKQKRINNYNKRIERVKRAAARGAFSEGDIYKLLKFVEKDITIVEYLLGTASQSSDATVALLSLALKRDLETGRRKSISVANELQSVYDEFSKTTKNMSLEKMYGEMVEVYSGKETGFNERLRFVDKYDDKKFKKALKEYIDSMTDAQVLTKIKLEIQEIVGKQKKGTASKEMIDRKNRLLRMVNRPNTKVLNAYLTREFYNANTVQLSAAKIQKRIDQMIREEGVAVTRSWAQENMNLAARKKHGLLSMDEKALAAKLQSEPGYFNELSTLSDTFLNEKWLKMYNKDGTPKNDIGKMHQKLVETYLDLQDKLPKSRRQGLILPGMYKSTKDRITEGQGVVNTLKRSLNEVKERLVGTLSDDTEYGSMDIYGGPNHQLPIYYHNNIAPEDTSLELVGNMMKYADMVHTYEARNSIMRTSMLLMDKLKTRDVGKQSSNFTNALDSIAKRLGIMRQQTSKGLDSRAQKRIEKFIEMQVFGHLSKEERVGNVRIDKVIGLFMQHASMSAFGLHADALARVFMGALPNLNAQISQQMIEIAGSDEFNMKMWKRGHQLFAKYGNDILLKDFAKSGNKTFIGQLIDKFDVIQGETRDNFGRKISGTTARKLMSTDALFVHRFLSEYEPQVALFLGMLDQTRVKTAEGKEVSLIEAYELVDAEGNTVESDGVLRLKEGIEFSDLEEIKLMNRMHALNKGLNGVYNSFDRSIIEQNVWGRMFLFFRKYLYPSMRRRWSIEYVDYEADRFERGYALSFWRHTLSQLTIHRKGLMNVIKREDMTTLEKMEAAKAFTSFMIGFSNMLIAGILRMMVDDDDEDGLVYNYMLYNALRLQSETWSFWNPTEMLRILKSPTIMSTYIERVTKFTKQAMFAPLETYDRDYAPYEKGDSKLYARFNKMILGNTDRSLNPEAAVRSFENLMN